MKVEQKEKEYMRVNNLIPNNLNIMSGSDVTAPYKFNTITGSDVTAPYKLNTTTGSDVNGMRSPLPNSLTL